MKKKEDQERLRAELDVGVEEQTKTLAREQQQEMAEAAGIQLFHEAKKVGEGGSIVHASQHNYWYQLALLGQCLKPASCSMWCISDRG